MQRSRVTRWRVGVAVLVGLLWPAGCMLLQPRVVVDFEANPVSGRTPHRVDFAPIAEGDVAEGKIYWSGSQGIHRANLDGTEQELIFSDVRADAIALDL